jgi:hypothetical protein
MFIRFCLPGKGTKKRGHAKEKEQKKMLHHSDAASFLWSLE